MIDGGVVDAFLCHQHDLCLLFKLYTIKDMGEGIIGKIGLVGFDGNPVFDFLMPLYPIFSSL